MKTIEEWRQAFHSGDSLVSGDLQSSRNKSLERVREAAQVVSDNMRASPSGDEYKFVGSTNDIDELNEALKEYTFLVRSEATP